MYMPDHPVIRNLERTGYPDGISRVYICPCCGAYDIDNVFIIDNEIVGCDQCVSEKEPWEADCEYKDVKL